jgi:hypothetical protein
MDMPWAACAFGGEQADDDEHDGEDQSVQQAQAERGKAVGGA